MNLKHVNKTILISLFLFMVISIISVYSATNIINETLSSIYIKQILFYLLGFLTIVIILKINLSTLYNISSIIYICLNLLLVLVLFFGSNINGSTSWFIFFNIFSFQPSEFMKIGLILFISQVIDKNTKNELSFGSELFLIFKVFIITFIPSILTFIQPDTGIVISYFVIMISMLFLSKIKLKSIILISSILLGIIVFFAIFYFLKPDSFIDLFGNSMFYRIDRFINWNENIGYQFSNSITSIGSSSVLGHGYLNNYIYIPEVQTDFIFSIIASNFGLIGAYCTLTLIIVFLYSIVNITITTSNSYNKLVLCGFLSVLLYNFLWNIGMIIGIVPITGITLPFISYGGSSLLVNMIIVGLILNIDIQNKKR